MCARAKKYILRFTISKLIDSQLNVFRKKYYKCCNYVIYYMYCFSFSSIIYLFIWGEFRVDFILFFSIPWVYLVLFIFSLIKRLDATGGLQCDLYFNHWDNWASLASARFLCAAGVLCRGAREAAAGSSGCVTMATTVRARSPASPSPPLLLLAAELPPR